MAKQEHDNTGRGVLFRNEKPRNVDSPFYLGRINIDGIEYWLSAWRNESKAGRAYITLVLGDEIPPQEDEEVPPKPRGKSPRSTSSDRKPRGSAGAARSRRAPPPDDAPDDVLEDDDIPL